MSFLWSQMLWLSALLPTLYFVLMRRKRKQSARYGLLSLIKEAVATGFAW